MQKDFKVIKDKKELYEYLDLPEEYFSDKIPENILVKINKAKAKERDIPTYLWSKNKYHETDCLNELYEKFKEPTIDVIDYKNVNIEEFSQKYEIQSKPVLVKGVADQWKKDYSFSWRRMIKDFGEKEMKIAESDDGKLVKMKFKNFIHYLIHQTDDSPLYLFENCDSNKKFKKKYDIPKYFKEDYFNYLTEKQRPPFRWLLVGPKRSGTKVHFDPNGTSAWNTSLHGYKLWVFFEEKYPRWIVNGTQHKQHGEGNEIIDYFLNHLPRIQKHEKLKIYTCIQGPNEMIFVPGGWWHGVINLTDTMAVTQNFMNTNNFDRVWKYLRIERQNFSNYFLRNLRKKNPTLYNRAKTQNIKDNFVMFKDKTGKNFVEDFSTTTVFTSDTDFSNASDYNTEYDESEVQTESEESSNLSIKIGNSNSEDNQQKFLQN